MHELLEANKGFAARFDKGDAPMPPARQVTIVACTDDRLHPEKFLSPEIGDGHVIRNAGGRAAGNEAAVGEYVEKIRSSPFISDDIGVSGYIYEAETGALRTVVPARS